jgi:hypothetical protein
MLVTTWRVTRLNPTVHTISGQTTTTNGSEVSKLYRKVCAVTLVKYDHPIVYNCPAALGAATYHLRFTRGGRVLLRVTETED